MYLFLAFLLVPIIEIALFIQVGGLIGLWPTLAIVVVTAVAGTWLVRTQGRLALARLAQSFNELRDPTEPLAHGAMILLAGVLLLTPGFFTDAIGLALMVPKVRTWVLKYLSTRVQVQSVRFGTPPRQSPSGPGDVIDGEYEDVTPRRGHDAGPSGWVRGPDRH